MSKKAQNQKRTKICNTRWQAALQNAQLLFSHNNCEFKQLLLFSSCPGCCCTWNYINMMVQEGFMTESKY